MSKDLEPELVCPKGSKNWVLIQMATGQTLAGRIFLPEEGEGVDEADPDPRSAWLSEHQNGDFFSLYLPFYVQPSVKENRSLVLGLAPAWLTFGTAREIWVRTESVLFMSKLEDGVILDKIRSSLPQIAASESGLVVPGAGLRIVNT